MGNVTDTIIKLGSIDRRWIFLLIAIVVILPLFFPLGLPIRPTDATQTGQFMAAQVLQEVAEEDFNLTYGEDYVLLGFRPGNEAVVKGIVSNIRKLYTIDSRNTLLEDIPMMEGINNIDDFDFLFSASAGYPGTVEWVQYAADPAGIPMSTGVTSIQVNEVMPYVNSGQINGVLAGMPGAAEYEALIGKAGLGTAGMDAQSIAHVVIVAFIIFGNVAFYLERKRSKKF